MISTIGLSYIAVALIGYLGGIRIGRQIGVLAVVRDPRTQLGRAAYTGLRKPSKLEKILIERESLQLKMDFGG